MQFPDDAHGSAALVADVIGGSKKGVWGRAAGVLFVFAHEQKDMAAFFAVMDIPLTGCRLGACGALTLPMEQAGTDGKVIIERGWRIILVGFVECDHEHIGLDFLEIFHALTYGSGLEESQGDEQLIA